LGDGKYDGPLFSNCKDMLEKAKQLNDQVTEFIFN
jgi:hypothetical protein